MVRLAESDATPEDTARMLAMVDSKVPFSFPTREELEALFCQKYGAPETTGWAPRQRRRWGYFHPADVYEASISKLIHPETRWLDVGGGHHIFPENTALSKELAERCSHVVAVDPSDNVERNPYVHERVKAFIEDFKSETKFDLATLRMVAEHIAEPEKAVRSLAQLVRPGGHVVIFTVDIWTPLAILSKFTPFALHYPLKRIFWGGAPEDTFPVQYKMNTRRSLRRLFTNNGFRESAFAYLDDLSTFSRYRWLNLGELILRKMFRTVGLTYPEHCLLGIYERNEG